MAEVYRNLRSVWAEKGSDEYLEPKTRKDNEERLWGAHLMKDEIVRRAMSELTPKLIQDAQTRIRRRAIANLEAENKARAAKGRPPLRRRHPTADPIVRKVMMLLSAVISYAARRGCLVHPDHPHIERAHPMHDRRVRVPGAKPPPVDPLDLDVIEELRAWTLIHMGRHGDRSGRRSDRLRIPPARLFQHATVYSTASQAGGPRPEDWWAFKRSAIHETTLEWDEAAVLGVRSTTKTRDDRIATVTPDMPVRDDWQTLFLLQGDAPTSALLFPNGHGQLITMEGEKNWRKRWFDQAKQAVAGRYADEQDDDLARKILKATPATMRHTYASLAAAAGIPSPIAASDMGHSTRIHEDTYVRPLKRYEDAPRTGRTGMAELARAARTRAYQRWDMPNQIPGELREALERAGGRI